MVVALMATVLSAKAEVEFAYEAGADIVSAYLWRGQYNGGLSFQPDLEIGYDGEHTAFRFGAWGTVGASDWKFQKGLPTYMDGDSEVNPNTYFVPEVDIFANFSFFGVTVGATHYYFFGGDPFFAPLEGSGSQTEVQAGYNFIHFFGDKAGAYINWYTMVAGADANYDDAGVAHRAFSSYLELGYDYTFENQGLTLGAQIGMSPWESPVYGNSKFAVTNIALKLNKEWEFDAVTLDLYALGSINPDGIDNSNVYVNAAGDEKICVQKLNGTIGLGIWF